MAIIYEPCKYLFNYMYNFGCTNYNNVKFYYDNIKFNILSIYKNSQRLKSINRDILMTNK